VGMPFLFLLKVVLAVLVVPKDNMGTTFRKVLSASNTIKT
jgi:hypothetical protein